jgi:hypothetical protein
MKIVEKGSTDQSGFFVNSSQHNTLVITNDV